MNFEYKKTNIELQMKINNRERVILEQRNVVLEKQLRINELEEELNALKIKLIVPHQEFLNKNIKSKKECSECRRATSFHFKCENEFCENFA